MTTTTTATTTTAATAATTAGAPNAAVVEAALVLLERMGLTPGDLIAAATTTHPAAARPPAPTFAEYIAVLFQAARPEPRCTGRTGAGSRRTSAGLRCQRSVLPNLRQWDGATG
jgi:hypothetical protein